MCDALLAEAWSVQAKEEVWCSEELEKIEGLSQAHWREDCFLGGLWVCADGIR